MLTHYQALLLRALDESGRAHGHAIGKALQTLRGRAMPIASLYKALHSLERSGFVKGEWENEAEVEVGRPRRRYYKLTGLGERALRAYANDAKITAEMFKGWVRGAVTS